MFGNDFQHVTQVVKYDGEDKSITLGAGFKDMNPERYQSWEDNAKWDTEIDGKVRLLKKEQYIALVEPDGLIPKGERKQGVKYKTKITKLKDMEKVS